MIATASWLQWLRHTEFPLLIEFALAWLLIAFLSVRYLVDYVRLRWEMSQLRKSPNEWSFRLPLTPTCQTRQAKQYREKPLEEQCSHLRILLPTKEKTGDDDAAMLHLLHNNLEARQLASGIMISCQDSKLGDCPESDLTTQTILRLQRIWPRALQIPVPSSAPQNTPYSISLILPAHREPPDQVAFILNHAHSKCSNPTQIQLIVVIAGRCPGLEDTLIESQQKQWGSFQLVSGGVGGRGSCMNLGAQQAKGRILTFLHADTLLPDRWDVAICKELSIPGENSFPANLCAFSMGIDMSSRGLSKGDRFRPGIRGADRVLGYLRCTLCRLPYGDSVLSIPAHVFEYLGGYPDQPLMEDFEIVTLMRKRSFVLQERMPIINQRIECSPRRWQLHGVAYTIFVNATCIHRYTKLNVAAEELYEFYYGTNPNKKTS